MQLVKLDIAIAFFIRATFAYWHKLYHDLKYILKYVHPCCIVQKKSNRFIRGILQNPFNQSYLL